MANAIINLYNGIGTLNVTLPEKAIVGQEYEYLSVVNDPILIDPFMNSFSITVLPESHSRKGNGKRRKPPTDQNGTDRDAPSGIRIPPIEEVYEDDWDKLSPEPFEDPFHRFSALRAVDLGKIDDEDENGQHLFKFYINMDNHYLKTELKTTSDSVDFVKARFRFGIVLLGIGILYQESIESNNKQETHKGYFVEKEEVMTVEEKVEHFTKAAAHVIIPIIENLGGKLQLDSE